MPEIPKEMVPEFVEQLKPVQAKEGEEPFFECKIHGTPKPAVKWYKNGRELGPDDGKIESLPDGTQRLHLPPVGPNDDGNYYECVATNPAGSARSGAPLTVTRTFIRIVQLIYSFSIGQRDTSNVQTWPTRSEPS